MAASVSESTLAVMRGRGRGRGLVATQAKKPGGEPTPQKSVRDHILQLKPGEVQSTFSFLTRPSPKTQEVLDEAVSEICNRALKEIEFVDSAVELIHKLWITEGPENASVRKPLLSRLQDLYKSRDNLLDNELQSYSTLLSELFVVLKIADQPLKAFSGPVYNVLKDLVERIDDAQDNLLSFHAIVSKHGAFLEKEDKVKMEELISEIRNAAITETKKLRRCIFLEVIELHACNWTMPNDIRVFYSDLQAELIEKEHDQK